jgi:hypothetical protein
MLEGWLVAAVGVFVAKDVCEMSKCFISKPSSKSGVEVDRMRASKAMSVPCVTTRCAGEHLECESDLSLERTP